MNHHPCYWCGSCGCSGACEAPEPVVGPTYTATVVADLLWEANSLETLLRYLEGIHEKGESICIWQGPLAVAVLLADGSLLSIHHGPHARRATT